MANNKRAPVVINNETETNETETKAGRFDSIDWDLVDLAGSPETNPLEDQAQRMIAIIAALIVGRRNARDSAIKDRATGKRATVGFTIDLLTEYLNNPENDCGIDRPVLRAHVAGFIEAHPSWFPVLPSATETETEGKTNKRKTWHSIDATAVRADLNK